MIQFSDGSFPDPPNAPNNQPNIESDIQLDLSLSALTADGAPHPPGQGGNQQYDTQSEFSEIPQFQVMGEHSYEPRYTEPTMKRGGSERYPTYYTDNGTDNIVSTAESIDIGDVGHLNPPSDVDSFQMPPQVLSGGDWQSNVSSEIYIILYILGNSSPF